LSLLPAGRLACSPHQLVGGTAFDRLIERARARFDYIVVDTPPVLCASESLVIAKAADGALLCALYDVSRSHQVRSASERMSRAGASVIGAVLAGLPAGRYSSRYGHYGYGSPYPLASVQFVPEVAGASDADRPRNGNVGQSF
jgi:Mrp family chromosome partitioning ATPase